MDHDELGDCTHDVRSDGFAGSSARSPSSIPAKRGGLLEGKKKNKNIMKQFAIRPVVRYGTV